MYKLIIIDDEINICNLIDNLIDYEALNIELVRKFTDSTECLDYIRSNKVDIIVSDIQMQGITGIQLLAQAKEMDPKIHFIIISGFNYFDYAKQAIQFGADNYLLKPIDKRELNGALSSVINKIDIENGREVQITAAKEHLQTQAIQLVARDFFNSSYNICERPICEIEKEYHVKLPYDSFVVAILHIDVMEQKYYTDSLLINRIWKKLHNTISSTKCSIFSLVKDARNIYILINYCSDDKETLWKNLRLQISKLHAVYGGEKQIKLTIGKSNEFPWGVSLGNALYEAAAAVKSRLFITNHHIISASLIQYDERFLSDDTGLSDFQAKVIQYVETMDTDTLKEFCRKAFAETCSSKEKVYLKMDKIKSLLYILATQIANTSKQKTDIEIKDFDGLSGNFMNAGEYFEAYMNMVDNFIQLLDRDSDKTEKWAVAKVKDFIITHYAEKLTLKKIADEVHLSSTYMGALFKATTGETINEYITQVRIDHAKQMLNENAYNITEIAEKTGFPDSKYFSKLFKKHVGVKPTQYREIKAKFSRRSNDET